MPSGKKSKQMRRAALTAPPPVQSKGGPRRRQASPRALAIGGAVVVVAAVGIGLALALSGGGGTNGIPKNVQTIGSLQNALPGAAEVNSMFKGIPQSGFKLGSPLAPVQMVEYIDLQCPICQLFETTVMPDIITKYVKTGKVRVEVRPWAFIGPDSFRGQAAMLAAAKQNKAFNYAQVLYDNQGTENTGWLSNAMVYQAAASIPGLNVPQLLSERGSSTVKTEAANVAAQAQADKVTGTPTVLVGKNGTKPQFVPLKNGGDEPTLVKALDAALAG